jgi:hypothetical protein
MEFITADFPAEEWMVEEHWPHLVFFCCKYHFELQGCSLDALCGTPAILVGV